MKKLVTLSVAATGLVAGLAAQSNVVPGLDGRLTVINDLSYWGRRGPAHPNGEVGMSMLNTMCNPGSVNIPWAAAMQENHPWFGFLITRVTDDRIEQINEWSFCKHAWTSVNVNGACGTCIDPGTGALMGLNCSDTYGAGINANRDDLGPPWEIDPWLGTWTAVGSYFDIGDPSQPGYPAPADGNDSLNNNIFNGDPVWNRVTVDEVDLLTPGASYYYGLQLVHNGEAVANRGDNLAHRGFNPSWNGSGWLFNNNSEGQVYGSILDRWPGATVHQGGNGNDDGRFFVASKVTPLGGGSYHYEYAVHNVDNSRAGASLRVPIDATATATNFSFGDIDTEVNNDWTVQRVGNEIVFTATANNPIEWNTIYNFGFDADFPPGASTCEIDEARPGPGANFVQVQTNVPGGSTIATLATYGQGCDSSVEIPQPSCASRNPAGGTLAGTLSPQEHIFLVTGLGNAVVESFDIWTSSTGGTVSVPANIYPVSGSVPAATPIATTTIDIGPTEGFYRATFNPPVNVSGNIYIGFDNTAQTTFVSTLQSGFSFVAYRRVNASSPWSVQIARPSYVINCVTPPVYQVPSMSTAGLPNLGATYDLQLSDALPTAIGVLASGLNDEVYQGIPLPVTLPGTADCDLLVSADVLDVVITDPAGGAGFQMVIPNDPAVVGARLFHQWAILDAEANLIGIVLSDAARATVGL